MKRIAMGVASTALALGGSIAMTAPAQAQPIAVGNLVNVQITNLLNNNDVVVAVPVNAAANICGVDVDVLTTALNSTGNFTDCRSRANQDVNITQ